MISSFKHIMILAFTNMNDKTLKRDDFLILIVHLILCTVLIFLLLSFPELAHEGADQGLALFLEALFPYLLPYLILTQWLLRLTSSFERPLSTTKLYAQTYLIGALGGFPTGATTIAYLKKEGQLETREASILLAICHAPSPLFVLGFVSNDLLGNYSYGWQFLFVIHLFNLIALIIFMLTHSSKSLSGERKFTRERSNSPFTDSIKDSAPVLLLVGITVVFFTTIQTITLSLFTTLAPNLPPVLHLVFSATLEMTNGLVTATSLFSNSASLSVILTAILAFQGLSIHLQIIVLARTAQLSIKPYIGLRLISVLVVPLLFMFIF